MWFCRGDDLDCFAVEELGLTESARSAEVFNWMFEVVLVTGFRLSFDTGTFFDPYMFPLFVVEVACFGRSSVEVVDEVSNPVFNGGAYGVHVLVWGDFELNQLVDFIRYIFESTDRI